jgi:hypothetical protein
MTSRAHPPFILTRNPNVRGQWYARDEVDRTIALLDGQGRINFYVIPMDVALVASLVHCADLVGYQWDEDSPLFGVDAVTISRRPTSAGVDLSPVAPAPVVIPKEYATCPSGE